VTAPIFQRDILAGPSTEGALSLSDSGRAGEAGCAEVLAGHVLGVQLAVGAGAVPPAEVPVSAVALIQINGNQRGARDVRPARPDVRHPCGKSAGKSYVFDDR